MRNAKNQGLSAGSNDTRLVKHEHPGTDCGSCCLRAEGLSVRHGETEVLQNVGLHIHCGEIVAVIGPNGAGKTTLFRAILGQVPYTGTLRFERADGAPMQPVVGYVPQSPAFDKGDPVSVQDLFVAAATGWPVFLPPPRALRERVLRALERVHGGALADRRVGSLSGGELQRVLLAMALEPLPNILILDEPFSGVDVEGEHQIWEMLTDISERFDLSILLSTHDFAALGQYADRAVLLNHTVLDSGPPVRVLGAEPFRTVFHFARRDGQ